MCDNVLYGLAFENYDEVKRFAALNGSKDDASGDCTELYMFCLDEGDIFDDKYVEIEYLDGTSSVSENSFVAFFSADDKCTSAGELIDYFSKKYKFPKNFDWKSHIAKVFVSNR